MHRADQALHVLWGRGVDLTQVSEVMEQHLRDVRGAQGDPELLEPLPAEIARGSRGGLVEGKLELEGATFHTRQCTEQTFEEQAAIARPGRVVG